MPLCLHDLTLRIYIYISLHTCRNFVDGRTTEKKEDGGGEVTERVITVAEAAINHLKDLKSKQGVDHLFLRMGVRSGGCSGMSYLLAFDKKEDKDQEYEIEGIPVVMNKAHTMYVVGMVIGWEEGLNNRGFTFTNPNATETCGCGQSFSA